MRNQARIKTLLFLYIVLLGLVPLLWFRGEELLASLDTTLPFTWSQCVNYFYLWNHQVATGVEFMLDPAYLVFNFTGGLWRLLGLSISWAQRLQFVFWFMIPGFAMYYLMQKLYSGKNRLIAAFIAVSFYMCNLYLETIWLGFNKSNIAVYAFLPFLLSIFILALKQEMSIYRAACLSGILSIFTSATGSNTPVAVVFAVPFIFFILYMILTKKREYKPITILKYASIIFFAVFVCNLFWILPQLVSAFKNIPAGTFGKAKDTAVMWLTGMSKNTGLINVLRMQGNWAWYAGFGEPYVPYAHHYQHNIFLIALSWLMPGLVLYGMWRNKLKHGVYFIALTLVSLFMSMGSSGPLGSVYLWLFKNVPFFWIMRAPWFKFTIITCLGYAVFLGSAADKLYTCINDKIFSEGKNQNIKKYTLKAVIGILAALILIYAYPVVLGKIFVSEEERTYLPSHRMKFPEYVEEAASWMDSQGEFFRIFCLPGDGTWINNWGYNGRLPSIYYFTKKPIITEYERGIISQEAPKESLALTKLARDNFSTLGTSYTEYIYRLLALMGIKYIIQENDFRYSILPEPLTNEVMLSRLKEQKKINYVRSFGLWDVYSVNKSIPQFYLSSEVVLLKGSAEDLLVLSSLDEYLGDAVFIEPPGDNQGSASLNNLDTVILSQGANLPQGLQVKKINIRHIFSTDNMSKDIIQASSEHNTVEIVRYNNLRQENRGGGVWRWFDYTTEENSIILNNQSSSPLYVNLRLKLLSYARERRIYFYLNGELLQHDPIEADRETVIDVSSVELQPGENTLRLYSPFEWDIIGDTKVSFAFSDFRIGKYLFSDEFKLATAGKYLFRLHENTPRHDKNSQYQVKKKKIIIDNDSIQLKYDPDENMYTGIFSLAEGSHKIALEQNGKNKYFILIKPYSRQQAKDKTSHYEEINYSRISPVLYKLNFYCKSPAYLIFNESYNIDWQATNAKSGQKINKAPIKVNGFANAWYLKDAGEYEVQVEFKRQKIYNTGLIISFIGLCSCILIIGAAVAIKRFRP